MAERTLPRYPIYIPSKGRAERCSTANFLVRDGVPFHLVVEPQEQERYASRFGDERLLILPFSDRGSVIPARNWIKEHATAGGHARHWQLDDNINMIMRLWRGKRIRCRSGVALAATEDFVDRYENIAVAGLNYMMFVVTNSAEPASMPPFYLNVHVYSCCLILNTLPYGWRGRYNEDTDLCLRVLADGWCTVLINVFNAQKIGTMVVKGGNTDELAYLGEGRVKMARALERRWPGIVTTRRRFRRPQHVVNWRKFDTPLKRRADVDWEALKRGGPNEYGMELKQVGPIKSAELRRLVAEQDREAS